MCDCTKGAYLFMLTKILIKIHTVKTGEEKKNSQLFLRRWRRRCTYSHRGGENAFGCVRRNENWCHYKELALLEENLRTTKNNSWTSTAAHKVCGGGGIHTFFYVLLHFYGAFFSLCALKGADYFCAPLSCVALCDIKRRFFVLPCHHWVKVNKCHETNLAYCNGWCVASFAQ